VRINIDNIVLRDDLWPRGKPNPIAVARLGEALQTGAVLPPVVIATGSNILVDGWLRIDAYRENGIKEIDAELRHYSDEAALFADAVRLNSGHGTGLDTSVLRTAVVRLLNYNYSVADITEIVRLPLPKVEEIKRGFGIAFVKANGEQPVGLKRAHDHMSGRVLTQAQVEVNKRVSTGNYVSLVNQLIRLLEADMWDREAKSFRVQMDRLVDLWLDVRDGEGEPATAHSADAAGDVARPQA
jgi:hypothetical protein